MIDPTSTLSQFLDAAAAKKPTPGGGAVAAVAGALAASMGEMVVNYSIGKKGLESHAVVFAEALAQLTRIRKMLLELMEEDQAAFENLTATRKFPADAPGRNERIKAATDLCITVPALIAAAAVQILEISHPLVDKANRFLLSDLAVCADLAMATVRCALGNVRINLAEITDADEGWKIQTTSARLLSRAIILIQDISPRIWQRLGEAAK